MPKKVKIAGDTTPATIDKILESYFWLPEIKTMVGYERLHDDHDGTQQGKLNVMFSPDGDARVWINGVPSGEALRFRMPGSGGGSSFRTRVALLILARAIILDEQDPMH